MMIETDSAGRDTTGRLLTGEALVQSMYGLCWTKLKGCSFSRVTYQFPLCFTGEWSRIAPCSYRFNRGLSEAAKHACSPDSKADTAIVGNLCMEIGRSA